jgi:L-threonylcarbamoyladenylate synthase
MSDVILYPTETVYALGVNPFDKKAWSTLCALKGRSEQQAMSWLVRDINDIEKYAKITPRARKIIESHLPGPLTIILEAKSTVPKSSQALDGTVSFRISSDKKAQNLIAGYMKNHGTPLTCTSANLHGEATRNTTKEIIEQFGKNADLITQIIDDGPRFSTPSTIVRVIQDKVMILRQGEVKL